MNNTNFIIRMNPILVKPPINGTPQRSTVEMHEGNIGVRSEGLGKGYEFVVRLPLEPQVAALESGESPRPGEDHHRLVGRTFRILVVDDLQDSADSLSLLLLSMNYAVRKAYDGEHAMRIAEEMSPDVAFIDLGMPGVDGSEVCRRIRAQPWGARMVLIARPAERHRVGAAGCCAQGLWIDLWRGMASTAWA